MGETEIGHDELNVVVVRGVLSSDPEVRILPSGDRIVVHQVTVARERGPADSVPVVWFDPPSSSPRVLAGDAVVAVGRVRRRFFRAGGRTGSATEVVADGVAPAGRAAARRLVARAAARLV